MRIGLFSPGYPSDAQAYNYAFVHARARLYQAAGHEVAAFALGERGEYRLDGVPVTTGDRDRVVDAIRARLPDVLAIHAPTFRMIAAARSLDLPQVSWVHGHEALFSFRAIHFAKGRLAKAIKLLKALPRNVHQLRTIRDFLPSQAAVVFVSDWMRREAERHTRARYQNAVEVPNPVDVDLFSYRLDPQNRTRGVSARALGSTKYGLDVAVRAFADLRHCSLTIVGMGSLEGKLRRLIERTKSNTVLEARHVPHRDMPDLLGRYGFFVAPSRVEAQGVAMCEAMACGLPVVATRVGGIPEFVTHMEEGLLVPPDDPETLHAAVIDLIRDEARYLAMSKKARARMERQCAPEVVTRRELAILASAAQSP